MKRLLYIATVIVLVDYLFWEQMEIFLGFQVFEILKALFLWMLCIFIFMQNRKSFICFFLFCASLNDLVDEVTGNWDKLYLSEAFLILILPLLWALKTQINVRKDTRD